MTTGDMFRSLKKVAVHLDEILFTSEDMYLENLFEVLVTFPNLCELILIHGKLWPCTIKILQKAALLRALEL